MIPADKGGVIIILNKTDYIKEGHRQLAVMEHYKQLHNDPTEQFKKNVENTLNSATNQDIIIQEMKYILYKENPRMLNLYLLPKIHIKVIQVDL